MEEKVGEKNSDTITHAQRLMNSATRNNETVNNRRNTAGIRCATIYARLFLMRGVKPHGIKKNVDTIQ